MTIENQQPNLAFSVNVGLHFVQHQPTRVSPTYGIIATHSAYFIREVSNEQVAVLSISDNRLVTDKPRLPTFGATVDSISQFIFQEDTDIRLSEKLYDKVKGKSFSDVEEQLGNEISLSALMRLKRMMEA